ncbi:hypothetical protein RSOLAG1IB_08154 [Rhizoctonia solani AG-1 IB]|uniref:Peptidase C14 caspase domain-containing protein n=1 Tax=Thanatephorus cucumeris (strain AG1-IB / isolate 7/3/14) TaxID=1108050 RepID=A0A0B7FFR6_THACB|nr:hypothetical protein RSOLAG1IB_08154 [Rhizoctonia solani AG-1 IB]
MSPSFPNAPVAKGRKSQSTRWLDILPIGPPSMGQSHLGTSAGNSLQVEVTPAPEPPTLQHESRLHIPDAFRLHAPQPRASPSLQPALNSSRTPVSRPLTSLGHSEIPINRAPTPSSRPRTPHRPPDIMVLPSSRICSDVTPYNPEDGCQSLRSSTPVSQGRRDTVVHAPANPYMLGSAAVPRPGNSTTSRDPRTRMPQNLFRENSSVLIPRCERRLLIIGCSYQDRTPYLAAFDPLNGIRNDRDRLRTAFQSRQYSVETMVEDEGNKIQVLRRIREFLASAEAGDIRVIVFTGHATKVGDREQFVIIPSGSTSDSDTISSAEWQSTILENASAGVVVVSIFATCMSGAMVSEDGVRLPNFERIAERQSSASIPSDGPIQIILSSSGDSQLSFEFKTPLDSSAMGWNDYFLWALAETTKRSDVDSWESFVKTLQTSFAYVRTAGFRNSSFSYPQDLDWLLNHPQTPRIYLSPQAPEFNRFMPPRIN